jgi:hypothetical protein
VHDNLPKASTVYNFLRREGEKEGRGDESKKEKWGEVTLILSFLFLLTRCELCALAKFRTRIELGQRIRIGNPDSDFPPKKEKMKNFYVTESERPL